MNMQTQSNRCRLIRKRLNCELLEKRLVLAGLVGVDFDFVDTEPSPLNWTLATTATTTLTDLPNENGTSTPYDLAISSDDDLQSVGSLPPSDQIPIHSNPLDDVAGNIYTNGAAITATWSDLIPGKAYDVYVFGSDSISTANTKVAIAGGGLPVVFTQSFTGNDLFVNAELGDSARQLSTYAKRVKASAGGEVVIEMTAVDGDAGLAGLAIDPVPELVGIDFGPAGDFSPTNWTSLTGSVASATDLIDESGATTPYDFSIVSDGLLLEDTAAPLPSQIPSHANRLDEIGGNIYSSGGTETTIVFGDLKPGDVFNVYLFGSDVFDASHDVDVVGAGAPVNFNQSFDINELFVNEELGDSARTLDSYGVTVVAPATGEISITLTQLDGELPVAGVAIERLRSAQGPLVGIDFGEPGDLSPANWTSATGADTSLTDLIDESGTGTPYDFAISSDGFFSEDSASPSFGQIPSHTNPLDEIKGNIWSSGGTQTSIVFSDLTPGDMFNVYLFGSDTLDTTNNVVIVGAGPPVIFTQAYAANELAINDQLGTSVLPLNSYAETVVASAAGEISITVSQMVGEIGLAGVAIEPLRPLVGVGFGLAAGSSPTNWTFSDGTAKLITDLIDEHGNGTPIDLSVASSLGISDAASTAPATQIPSHWNPLGGLDENIYVSAGDGAFTFTWSDLAPGQLYDVYVFGSDTVSTTVSDVSIAGAGTPITFRQSFSDNEMSVNDELGDNGRDISSFSKTVPSTSDGEIVITVSEVAGEGGDAGVAGLAISPVAAAQDGDFDNNGFYQCADIDALIAEIAAGTNNPLFDMSGDGLVNLTDRDIWLYEAGNANLGLGRSYLLGDANLDSFVDGLDFIIWNSNKFTETAEWCSGDFNADGFVDGLDFIIWNANKFTEADVAAFGVPANTTVIDVELTQPNIGEVQSVLDESQVEDRPIWAADAPTQPVVRHVTMTSNATRAKDRTEIDDYFAALEPAIRR